MNCLCIVFGIAFHGSFSMEMPLDLSWWMVVLLIVIPVTRCLWVDCTMGGRGWGPKNVELAYIKIYTHVDLYIYIHGHL